MGAIFLYVTIKILLAIRGGPYMTPVILPFYLEWAAFTGEA